MDDDLSEVVKPCPACGEPFGLGTDCRLCERKLKLVILRVRLARLVMEFQEAWRKLWKR